jgi:hypothetical protein
LETWLVKTDFGHRSPSYASENGQNKICHRNGTKSEKRPGESVANWSAAKARNNLPDDHGDDDHENQGRQEDAYGNSDEECSDGEGPSFNRIRPADTLGFGQLWPPSMEDSGERSPVAIVLGLR